MTDALSTVTRTLQVLEAFSYAEPVLGVSEIARKLDMSKSSVHRALITLLESGYVAKTPDDRYRLGLKLHELGQLMVSGLRLHEVAHGPLERLRQTSQDSVHLAVLDGLDVVYIDRFESANMASVFKRVGRRIAPHVTSSGKCLLAFGEAELVEAVIARGLKRFAARSITSAAGLRDILVRVRTDGYAVSSEERETGITSVGAPVFGLEGSCIAAVSMVGSSMRMRDEQLTRSIRQVRRCAVEISEAMGQPPRARR